MQERSTKEWIAITVAVVIGLGLFVLGFFIFAVGNQSVLESPTGPSGLTAPDDGSVENEVPVPGFEDEVEEMIVEEESAN